MTEITLKIDQEQHIRHILQDYSMVAHNYDYRWRAYLNAIHGWILHDIYQDISLHDVKIQNLLDVACGTGLILQRLNLYLTDHNIPTNFPQIGMDITPAMIDMAKEANKNNNVMLMEQNIELPWPELITNHRFSHIFSLSVLHHLHDHIGHLQKLHQNAMDDGYIYLADFAIDKWPMKLAEKYWQKYLPSHQHAYSTNGLQDLIDQSALFTIEKHETIQANYFWRVQILKLRPKALPKIIE